MELEEELLIDEELDDVELVLEELEDAELLLDNEELEDELNEDCELPEPAAELALPPPQPASRATETITAPVAVTRSTNLKERFMM